MDWKKLLEQSDDYKEDAAKIAQALKVRNVETLDDLYNVRKAGDILGHNIFSLVAYLEGAVVEPPKPESKPVAAKKSGNQEK